MAGVRQIKGHQVQLLSDLPIVGPSLNRNIPDRPSVPMPLPASYIVNTATPVSIASGANTTAIFGATGILTPNATANSNGAPNWSSLDSVVGVNVSTLSTLQIDTAAQFPNIAGTITFNGYLGAPGAVVAASTDPNSSVPLVYMQMTVFGLSNNEFQTVTVPVTSINFANVAFTGQYFNIVVPFRFFPVSVPSIRTVNVSITNKTTVTVNLVGSISLRLTDVD